MHEDTELAGVQGTAGISRRDMLRKSAVVGGAGALMWAAPSITKFGGAAWGTPLGKGISYIAVKFTCLDGTVGFVKWDFHDTYDPTNTVLQGCDQGSFEKISEGGNFSTPFCAEDPNKSVWEEANDPDWGTTPVNECDWAGKFVLTIDELKDGEPVTVTVTMMDDDCSIDGNAYAKCATDCIHVSNGSSVTFSGCGI